MKHLLEEIFTLLSVTVAGAIWFVVSTLVLATPLLVAILLAAWIMGKL